MKSTLNHYENFLKSYSLTKEQISKIGYSDKNGYPLKDALFDRIVEDYREHIIDDSKLNEMLDDDDFFNDFCELTDKKVIQLLRA